MTSYKYELHCPRCNKTTNQAIEIQLEYNISQAIILIQRCGNCELQRSAVVKWGPWEYEETNLIKWEREQ